MEHIYSNHSSDSRLFFVHICCVRILAGFKVIDEKFEQSLIDKRSEQVDHVIIDTPGQIEVFTWSASGTIITETLASTTPTVILYVMDVAKVWVVFSALSRRNSNGTYRA